MIQSSIYQNVKKEGEGGALGTAGISFIGDLNGDGVMEIGITESYYEMSDQVICEYKNNAFRIIIDVVTSEYV